MTQFRPIQIVGQTLVSTLDSRPVNIGCLLDWPTLQAPSLKDLTQQPTPRVMHLNGYLLISPK